MKRFVVGLTAWVWLGLLQDSRAQIVVAPLAFELNDRIRSKELYVNNNGNDGQEVLLEAVYGIPQNAEDGTVQLVMADGLTATPQNAAPWISLFPRRLRLQPGERQVVRVVASPPAGLEPAEYWSRIVVTSQAVEAPQSRGNRDSVQVQLNMQFRTILGLLYRSGAVETGIQAQVSRSSLRNDTLSVVFSLGRTGNAAYLGQVDVEVFDDAGNRIASAQEILTVYTPLSYALQIPLPRSSNTATPLRWVARFHTGRHIPEVTVLRAEEAVLSGTVP